MPLRHDQLAAALSRGLKPVYLIGGPEPLLLQECRDLVLATARGQGFLERELLQVDRGFDWDTLHAMSGAPSLFSSRRVVDLRMPTGKPGKDGSDALCEWAANPDPDTLLVVSCETWDASSRKSKWASELERAGTRVDIWPVKAEELPGWIKRRMQAAGLEPDTPAVEALADRVEGNLLAAQQEIDKLLLQKGPGKVSAADVLEVVADNTRFDASLLVERLLTGNLPDALRVATGLRRTGVAIQFVTIVLYNELKVLDGLLQALAGGQPESAAFGALGVWPSRQGPLRKAAGRIAPARLARGFTALALIDRQSKGQAGGDPWQELDRLVRLLCA